MNPHIVIHWIGHRKDGSNRGSVWGWFTEAGKPDAPIHRYLRAESTDPHCYVFWGRIGKTMYIEQRFITSEFMDEAAAKAKNFKMQDPEKITSRWGKVFKDELSMYIMTLKLRG